MSTARRDLALLLLRLGGVGLAMGHGWGKITALGSGGGERFVAGVSALGFPLPEVFAWAAALTEFLGGLAIALGLGTRIAASLATCNLLVAAFLRHRFHQQLLLAAGLIRAPEEVVDQWGDPELALVYLVIMLTLLLVG
ncbi:MAG: DoxX family protein, partial [Acidobacteriota bacterium]